MKKVPNHRADERRLSLVAVAVAIAVAMALSKTAFALSVAETGDLGIRLIPTDVISLDRCPPHCTARTYSQLHPSDLYRPLEPDEIIFEGEVSLIWGSAPGSEWLIWGRSDDPTITVWDDSMWVEDVDIETRGLPGVAPSSRYSVSEELKIRNPAHIRSRGGRARSRGGPALADAEPSDLGSLDDVPADLLRPPEKSWLSKLLARLSKSQYAVGGVTIGLLVLMARLVR